VQLYSDPATAGPPLPGADAPRTILLLGTAIEF
jgi:hypothetical protein